MANNPFDQRIINQLERPTSSDLNIAQGQINANVRAFARQLLQSTQSAWADGVGPGGALGNSFIIRAAAPPSLTEVTMTRGVGFASYADTAFNIGTITGLNTNLDYPVIYSQDRVLDLSGAPNPATPSTCRRDVIAIRAIGQSVEGLTDSGDTDIYEPSLEAFQAQARFKTLTADLTGQNLTVLDNTQPTTQPIVCIKGAEFAYSGPDSFLSATATTATTTGYINLAIINRYEGQTQITESDIVDYRLVASPGGQLTITGSATVGSNGLDGPGTNLTGVTIKAPPGIKASIYKLGANSAVETNTYALIVAGPRGIASANMTCTLGMPGGDYTAITTLLPSQVITGPVSRNLSADAATVALLADPAKSSPVQTVAVGQPYHVFPFTVGTVENVMDLVTAPITVTAGGSITIGDPPNYPAMYPAGTYDVDGDTNTRTFYLDYGNSAQLPTTGISSTVYELSPTASGAASTAQTILDGAITTSYAAYAAFLVDADQSGVSIPPGVWKLAQKAMFVGADQCVMRARVYLYNGTALGSAIGTSDDVWLPETANLSDSTNESAFYVPFYTTYTIGVNRVCVVLEYKRLTTTGTSNIKLWFNGDTPSILDTNIAIISPTVTIPDSTTNYPAATYPVTGSAGTVSFSIPTQYPKFNPETIRFRVDDDSPDIITRTIPVNFTVTLNRS